LDAIWPAPRTQRLALSLILGAIAAASGPGATSLPGTTSPPGERRVALLDSGLAVVAFAIILAFFHPRTAGATAAFWWAPWLLITLTCGILVGLLFLSVTRVRHSPADLLLALLGCLVLGAGVGYAAGFSPIVICWVAGAVIAALSPHRRAVVAQLEAWERPAYAVLLVVAGAWLQLPTLWILAAALALAGFRIVARWLAALIPGGGGKVGSRAGLAQGGVVVALGASHFFIFGAATGWALTVVLIGVALAQLAAALTAQPASPEVRG
jgi:xanthosine utilization system XapX-like protein